MLSNGGAMRLWSINPIFLDYKQHKALRNSILAVKSTIEGRSTRYRNDPHVLRFTDTARNTQSAIASLCAYAWFATSKDNRFMEKYFGVNEDDYNFDNVTGSIAISKAQILYEFSLLQSKIHKSGNVWKYRMNKKRSRYVEMHNEVFFVLANEHHLAPWENNPDDFFYKYSRDLRRTEKIKIIKDRNGEFYADY
jgi:hypothetical protein